VVSVAVFLASSTWFSGTAVIPWLRTEWGLGEAQSAWLTIAVQLGFIAGTFLYAAFNVADVFSARAVFGLSALLGAAVNLGFAWGSSGLSSALVFRFLTGLTLAGVYPVGMKIVASWFREGLGSRLGVMVGALTLGTAAPYLVRAVSEAAGWRAIASVASVLSALGAALVALLVADGPYARPPARFDPRAALRLFADRRFRWNAFGYFGHMWELYAVWSLISFYLAARVDGGARSASVSLGAFLVVAIGALGCVAGGWASTKWGERRVALAALLVSGAACMLSGLAFALPLPALAAFVLVWGFFVVADSPQFSALAARYAPPDYVATALTVQNGVGFLVTVLSLQLVPLVAARIGWPWAFTVLAPGPLIGAFYMWRLGR
jgi:MFS family permease